MRSSVFLTGVMLVLAGCGDPLSGVMRISEVDLAETDPTAQALPSADEISREGFFGTDAAAGTDQPQVTMQKVEPAAPRRRGLLGMLRRAVPATQPSARASQDSVAGAEGALPHPAFDAAESAEGDNTQVASLSPEEQPGSPLGRKGFFGRLTAGGASGTDRKGADTLDVAYGTVVPYGVIARVCEAGRKPLGRKVQSAQGSGYTLYDSRPDTSGARTFYITGFDDGCPRQLTAAHVLLGAPSFYEQLHYGPAGQHLTFGETDRAYEKVKGRVCGVRKGKPCGSKMRKLERDTFFVNSYERMNDNTRWSELLVHDGVVVASAVKTSG